MLEMLLVPILVVIVVIILCAFMWYRVVPPSQAHMVVTPKKRMVCSPDEKVSIDGGSTYYAIPNFIPFIGRAIRIMDVTIKELVLNQETYEKNQARYMVRSSIKYRIKNVLAAAETFVNDSELKEQLKEVIQAAVRAVTVKYDVTEARANKQLMSEEIEKEIVDDLSRWGLELQSFQLVDFQDTDTSKIISNISKRREVEIESETREMNAEKIKQAKIKEAESDEKAKEREILRDQTVQEKQQLMIEKVAEREKEAREKQLEVVKVQKVKSQEIEKAQQLVLAAQQKEVEKINKEKKQLQGEGDRLMQQEQAIGKAAELLEKLKAEAKGKDELQKSLNKFGDKAITALVAEQIVEKDKAVGIAGADALKAAKISAFLGGGNGGEAFDVGKALEALTVSNPGAADSVLHKIKVPNDLGGGIPIKSTKT